MCLLATVRAAQQSAHVAWQDLVACAIALLVAYIAASWLLMDSTAGFVHAKRDRRQLQQAADGQLLMPNGGAAPYGYSAGGPAAHKHGWHNGQQVSLLDHSCNQPLSISGLCCVLPVVVGCLVASSCQPSSASPFCDTDGRGECARRPAQGLNTCNLVLWVKGTDTRCFDSV